MIQRISGCPRNGRNRDRVRQLSEKIKTLITRANCHRKDIEAIVVKYKNSGKPLSKEDVIKLAFHRNKVHELIEDAIHFARIRKVHAREVLVLA